MFIESRSYLYFVWKKRCHTLWQVQFIQFPFYCYGFLKSFFTSDCPHYCLTSLARSRRGMNAGREFLLSIIFFCGTCQLPPSSLPPTVPLTDISINMVGAKKLKHTFMIIVTFQSCEHSYRVTWLTYQMAIRLSVRFGPLVPGVAFLFITPSCIRWPCDDYQ